jgi:hypothetical protein
VLCFPVSFDEAQVVAYGLTRALEAGALELFVRAPLTVSNGLTPLWFALQAGPAALLGPTNPWGLRVVPLLLGLATVCLAASAARRLSSPRAGWIAAWLVAAASPLVYTNARGEFAESLLVPLALCLLCDLLPSPRPVPLRAAVWPALALLAYLGKGLLLYAAYALLLLALCALTLAGRLPAQRCRPRRLCALLALPLMPTLLFLAVGQLVLFGGPGPVVTDVGPVGSLWELLTRLTFGYGSLVREDMVGGPAEVLFVYRDLGVWPSCALLALPMLAVLAEACGGLARSVRARDAGGLERRLLVLLLAMTPLVVVLSRGVLDVRFHLLSQALLIPWVAAALDRWGSELTRERSLGFAAAGAASLLAPLLGLAVWGSRIERAESTAIALLALGGVALAWLAVGAPGRGAGRNACVVVVALVAASSVLLGPLQWATRFAWEPGPLPAPLPPLAADFGCVELQVARRFVERGGVAQASPHLARVIEACDGDRNALLEAGGLLVSVGGAQVELVARAAQSHLHRHPQDAEVNRLLRRALRLWGAQNQAGRQVP